MANNSNWMPAVTEIRPLLQHLMGHRIARMTIHLRTGSRRPVRSVYVARPAFISSTLALPSVSQVSPLVTSLAFDRACPLRPSQQNY